ncbi:MAG: hypothetical protein WAM42_09975, partial [Candidatus Nitrosopolaris sp.]
FIAKDMSSCGGQGPKSNLAHRYPPRQPRLSYIPQYYFKKKFTRQTKARLSMLCVNVPSMQN